LYRLCQSLYLSEQQSTDAGSDTASTAALLPLAKQIMFFNKDEIASVSTMKNDYNFLV